MKTKNVRVRIKDIKFGAVIYTAHPFFGVRKTTVKSKPYMEKGIGLFFKTLTTYDGGSYKSSESIRDAGINSGDSYNDRKTFFKEKQAISYMNKMKTDKSAIARHEKHIEFVRETDWQYV